MRKRLSRLSRLFGARLDERVHDGGGGVRGGLQRLEVRLRGVIRHTEVSHDLRAQREPERSRGVLVGARRRLERGARERDGHLARRRRGNLERESIHRLQRGGGGERDASPRTRGDGGLRRRSRCHPDASAQARGFFGFFGFFNLLVFFGFFNRLGFILPFLFVDVEALHARERARELEHALRGGLDARGGFGAGRVDERARRRRRRAPARLGGERQVLAGRRGVGGVGGGGGGGGDLRPGGRARDRAQRAVRGGAGRQRGRHAHGDERRRRHEPTAFGAQSRHCRVEDARRRGAQREERPPFGGFGFALASPPFLGRLLRGERGARRLERARGGGGGGSLGRPGQKLRARGGGQRAGLPRAGEDGERRVLFDFPRPGIRLGGVALGARARARLDVARRDARRLRQAHHGLVRDGLRQRRPVPETHVSRRRRAFSRVFSKRAGGHDHDIGRLEHDVGEGAPLLPRARKRVRERGGGGVQRGGGRWRRDAEPEGGERRRRLGGARCGGDAVIVRQHAVVPVVAGVRLRRHVGQRGRPRVAGVPREAQRVLERRALGGVERVCERRGVALEARRRARRDGAQQAEPAGGARERRPQRLGLLGAHGAVAADAGERLARLRGGGDDVARHHGDHGGEAGRRDADECVAQSLPPPPRGARGVGREGLAAALLRRRRAPRPHVPGRRGGVQRVRGVA